MHILHVQALKKSKKRVAEAEEYKKFLNNSAIERTESRDLNQTTQKNTHEEMPSIDYNKNLIDILQDLKDFVSDKVQKMEEKLENMREACENTVSKIEEVIRKFHSFTVNNVLLCHRMIKKFILFSDFQINLILDEQN